MHDAHTMLPLLQLSQAWKAFCIVAGVSEPVRADGMDIASGQVFGDVAGGG